MKNVDRQRSLDKKKWISSQIHREDLSGKMFYCEKCHAHDYKGSCRASQKEREVNCLCAKAYNRAMR